MATPADAVAEVLRAAGMDAEVLDEYDLVVLNARPARGGVKLRTAAGARLLRRVQMPVERLRYVHLGAEYAAARGVPGVPRFIRNRYGDAFVVHDTGLYHLTAWVSGRDPDVHQVRELAALARELAGWHRAMAEFGRSVPARPAVRPLCARLEAALPQLEQSVPTDAAGPFLRLYAACQRELVARLRWALAACHDGGYEAQFAQACEAGATCHGRFVRQSLVHDGQRWRILDYDRMYPGLPVEDLALFLHRYMPLHDWSAQALAHIVASYEAVRPLPEAERRLLAALLSVPLRSIQVVLWHGASARGWEEDDYVDALEASLELEEPREAAIAALFSERRAVGGLEVRGSAAPAEASAGARPAADSATEGADVPVVFDSSERTQTVLAAASGAREGGVSAAAHGGVSPAGQNGVSAAAHDGVSQDPEPAGGMASRAAEALTRQAEPPFAQAGEGEKAERDEDRRDRGRRPRPGRRRRRRGRTAGGGAEGAPADAPAAGSNGTAARAPGAGPVDVRPGAGPGQPPGLWRRPDSPGR